MGFWSGAGKVLVWAFARETEFGRKVLGRETLAEQWAREHREKQERLQGRWFTKYVENAAERKIHLLIDKDGNVTDRYPHVHVIHDEVAYRVIVQVSVGRGSYPHREELPGSASGNEVNAAIDRALAVLRTYC